MTWEAHVEQDPFSRHVKVWLFSRGENDTLMVQRGDSIIERVDAGADPGDPTLYLPAEALASLYAGIGQALGTFTDGQAVTQLRRDYDAERARVDRFISHLTA